MFWKKTILYTPHLKLWYKYKKIVKRSKRVAMPNQELQLFLKKAGLEHLYQHFTDEGMELKYLLIANEDELKCLATRLIDRIKLRSAIESQKAEIDSVQESMDRTLSCNISPSVLDRDDTSEPPLLVDGCFGQSGSTIPPPLPDLNVGSSSSNQLAELQSPSSTPLMFVGGGVQNSLTDWVQEEWQFVQEIGPLEDKKPLKELLEHTTFGKALLQKQGQPLIPRERKALVQLIVEHQLRILPSIKDTIRQEAWTSWANEICSIFKGEQADIYYVPYRVTERQALPASGLLHNRLITHRRFLKPGASRKRSSSSGSSASSEKLITDDRRSKRVRPLPPALNTVEDEDSEKAIKWLEASSSPFEVVFHKWKASFQARHDILKKKSINDYFSQFLSLQLPTGHQLLVNDFEKAYPLASATFEEHFPIIKKRLLELLVEKGSDIRAEPAVTDLLDLATAGEEQGSVAALRCVPYLLKQIAPIPTKVKGKKWKPARSEVSSAFIAHVSSPGDIERCIDDRVTLIQDKGIHFGPYIIAVGPSWSTITQYEVVVSKSVRYQFSDIKKALTTAFKIYFALDIEYSADVAPCWMFVQRAVFKITTKFDVLYDKSVTLRELIRDCERFL